MNKGAGNIFSNFKNSLSVISNVSKIQNYMVKYLYNMKDDAYPKFLLSSAQILRLIFRMVRQINQNLGKISCETAFIAASIAKSLPEGKKISQKDVVLLSLFHLFGFLHFFGEEAVRLSELTQEEIYHSFLYGYYYLKEMSPLGENAKTLLFYDKKYDKNLAAKIPQVEYASLIFTAQSIQSLLADTKGNYFTSDFQKYGFSKFNQFYLLIFRQLDIDKVISKKIIYNSFQQDMEGLFDSFEFSEEETSQLFKLMIYLIDFKSTQTVQHIIHTACYAVSIGKLKGLPQPQLDELFTAGILHDLGKIEIPNMILESPGRLSAFEYRVMKTHVEKTETILRNIVPKKIIKIAVHHHEKLNGMGYPERLFASALSEQDRILTVADIFSALVDKRSYKEKFDKENIIEIYKKMANDGEIEKGVPDFIQKNYSIFEKDRELYAFMFGVPLGMVEVQYQEEISSELQESEIMEVHQF